MTTAELPKENDPNALYVVDISGYIYRAYHALPPLSSSHGEPTHAIRGVASMMMKLFAERKPSNICVAVDARGKSIRRELFPEYKANRNEMPADLGPQIVRVMEVLRAWNLPLLEAEGFEADDVIATVVRQAREKKMTCVIVSADKDLLQLVGDGVVMYDTMRERVFGADETEEKFGVPPNQVRDLLALMGDASDNVPGVPSVGIKTAAKLLKAHKSLDGIYEALESVKGRVKTKLTEHKDQAYLSQDLVTLREHLDLDISKESLEWDGGDGEALRRIFTELDFNRMLGELDTKPPSETLARVITTRAELDSLALEIQTAGGMAFETALDGDDEHTAGLVGIAVSCSDGVASYIPVAHRTLDSPSQLSEAEVMDALGPLLRNSLLPKYCADLKREDLVVARSGVKLRGGAFDVGIGSYLFDPGRRGHGLAVVARTDLGIEVNEWDSVRGKGKNRRALDECSVDETAPIAAQRADFVWRIFGALGPRMEREPFRYLLHEMELPLVAVLADMEREGVRVDSDLLKAMSVEAVKEEARLEAKAHELAGHEFNVGSPRQLETILFDELELPVIKKTKTARSTDASVLEELAVKHPLPATIIEHRSVSKLRSTYLDALPLAVNKQTQRIHTRYNQTVAATGRLSSSDPNLQNIPIRTELGRRVRQAFIPADGCRLLAADYSQIELRVLAHISEDEDLLDAYRTGADVHARTASALFDVDLDAVTREQRGQGKTVNFAVIYGQTQFALARNLRVERSEAKRYIEAFFERYSGVKAFMDAIVEEAHSTGYVTTLLGRRRALNDIRSRNRHLRAGAERIARNTPIQGTAADIIKLAMVAIHKRIRKEELKARMILSVHDELVFEVPTAESEVVEALVREEMEGAMELRVPLVADCGFGDNWGAAH